jgi:hypothetical protein
VLAIEGCLGSLGGTRVFLVLGVAKLEGLLEELSEESVPSDRFLTTTLKGTGLRSPARLRLRPSRRGR